VEAQAPADVQAKVETQTQAPALVQPPVQAEKLSGLSVKSHAEIAAIPLEEPHDLKTELLEVAEALDQHRLWVESNGKEGFAEILRGRIFRTPT